MQTKYTEEKWIVLSIILCSFRKVEPVRPLQIPNLSQPDV